jgi:hypothetical protein
MRRFLFCWLALTAAVVAGLSLASLHANMVQMPFTTGGGGQSIASVAPATGSFSSTAAAGSLIAAVGVTMSPATPVFSGTVALQPALTTDAGCTGATVTPTTNFQLSSTTLPSNLQTGSSAPLAAGTYCVHLVATQAGATGSPFTQVVALTSAGPLALSAHGVGAVGGATASTTATMTLAGVAAGDRHIVFWVYCTSNCDTGSGTPVAASSVAGTLGSTCAEVPAVRLAFINSSAGGYAVIGGAVCGATTSAGSDTFTVTFASAVQYGHVWAVGYSGATVGEDTACRITTSSAGAAQTTWSATTTGNLTAAPEAIVSILVNGDAAGVPTASTGTLLDYTAPNTGQTTLHRIGGPAGSPATLNGTWAAASYWGQVMLCLH